MRRAGFAVGTAMQQSSLPLAAVIGLVIYHDQLSAPGLARRRHRHGGPAGADLAAGTPSGPQPVSGGLFGLLSGLCFGFSLNAFRHAGLALEPHHPVVSALTSVAVAQAAQALGLTVFLALRDRGALRAVVAGWRDSLARRALRRLRLGRLVRGPGALAGRAGAGAGGDRGADRGASPGGVFSANGCIRCRFSRARAVLAGVLLTTLR